MTEVDECSKNMKKAIEHLKQEFSVMRTNRPSPSMLDGVTVEVYGSEMRMRDVATVTVSDGNQLLISPFDPSSLNSIAKGIDKSNLNMSPIVDGNIVRLPIPPMSEDRRREIAKDAKEKSEKAKIVIREIRRNSNDLVKAQKISGEITEDIQKKTEKKIQELTDTNCREVDNLYQSKEKDIFEV